METGNTLVTRNSQMIVIDPDCGAPGDRSQEKYSQEGGDGHLSL